MGHRSHIIRKSGMAESVILSFFSHLGFEFSFSNYKLLVKGAGRNYRKMRAYHHFIEHIEMILLNNSLF